MRLFGFEFSRIPLSYDKGGQNGQTSNAAISFVEKSAENTAALVSSSPSFGSGTFVDVQGTIKSEAELVSRYREMLLQPEVDKAVDEIVNESICIDEDYIIKLDLDDVPLDPQSKAVIEQNFEEIVKLLEFNTKSYWIYKRWYVDGRLRYHAVIDPKRPMEGIKELRYTDPRKLRLIKEVDSKRLPPTVGMNQTPDVINVKNEYYLYNEAGFGGQNKNTSFTSATSQGGIRIAKDAIVDIGSGVTDINGTIGQSYLHSAMRILTQLRTIEDSLIIYRLARAPERRVWYVDVGELPVQKAEQYVRNVMTNQKNKLVYDSSTGTIQNDRKFMTMLEDYWIPRRADGGGTRVESLPAGKTLGEIEDILYFQKQLYGALNVPIARLNPDSPFMLGRTNEVSRDEIKFDKFVGRLRQQFSTLFTECLKKHMVLKQLMTIEEFEQLSPNIKFEFARDNHFAELKDSEILAGRLQTLNMIMPFIGSYYSHKWVRRNILKQTDADVEEMTNEVAQEMQDPLYQMAQQQGDPIGGGGGEQGGGDVTGEEGSEGPDSQTKDQYAQEEKIDKAKHVVQALTNIKQKTPGEITKLRSAAQILAKN